MSSAAPKPPSVEPPIGLLKRKSPMFPEGVKCACCGIEAGALSVTPAQLAKKRKLQSERGFPEDVDDTHALMNFSSTCGLCRKDPLCSECAWRGRKVRGTDLCCQCIFDTDGTQANHGGISSLPAVAMEPRPEDAGEPLPPPEVAKAATDSFTISTSG